MNRTELSAPAPVSSRVDTELSPRLRILFVSHEASRTGAPMFLLHFLRWLRQNTKQEFDVLIGKKGPLEEAFRQVAQVYEPSSFLEKPAALKAYGLIYSNTGCNGELLRMLAVGEIPVITHFHELDMGFHWIGPKNMAEVIRQTNHFVACAQIVASRLQQVFHISKEKIGTHYEMIDGAKVTAQTPPEEIARLRQEYDLPENSFIVTACGTFDLRKAPDLFIQFASRLKRQLGSERPVRFLWIGSINNPDLVQLMREDVRKLGMEQEIRFVGELASPHALIGLSDLFCLTSREDPFPLIMLEAAALAKPVLCFDGSGGASEFCAIGGGMASPYLDVGAMADTAFNLLRAPDRRAAIGRKAAAVVQERFVVEAVAPGLWREIHAKLQNLDSLRSMRDTQGSLADVYRSWSIDECPRRDYVLAHLARERVFQQATEFVRSDLKKEAIQALVRAASQDIASKDPLIIFESLVEIGDALAELEPKHSAYLLGEAARISRLNPLMKIESFRNKAKPHLVLPRSRGMVGSAASSQSPTTQSRVDTEREITLNLLTKMNVPSAPAPQVSSQQSGPFFVGARN